MPELRHDPIQKRWVIIATERQRRPSDFQTATEEHKEPGFCPFCEGNETKTPPEIFAFRKQGTKPNTPGWDVRVVANKFPALMIEGELEKRGLGNYDRMQGVGAHEVIIETPDHNMDLAEMPIDHLVKILRSYQERIRDLMKDRRFKYILIFKNHGLTAGASLSHPHSQLIATPITPRTVAMELVSARDHFFLKERCLFCDIIDQELQSWDRVVKADENYVVLCPYASRFPFETVILPKKHQHSFLDVTGDSIRKLAFTLRESLLRMKLALNDPPYNFMLHTAPNRNAQYVRAGYWATLPYDFHWHIEIFPRLTRVAGFEWGTGYYINPTPPETASKYLRELKIPHIK